MTGIVTTGVVAFSNLEQHEEFRGQSTGRYSLVITMGEADAGVLEDMGVRVKDYEGKAQRKFASKYKVDVLDLDGNPVQGEIPYGSTVRVLWKAGDPHPEFGVPTYLNKVRLVELSDNAAGDDVPDEF